MTVEFEPLNEECFGIGAPNGHFFEMLRIEEFSQILHNPPMTNDEILACEGQAKQLAKVLENHKGNLSADKQMYIDFFNNCQGFITS